MITSFQNKLPGTAKVWVYQSGRKFTEGEAKTITSKLRQFVAQWTSHKSGVVGDGALLYDLFIVFMADEEQVAVSGCSVDSSIHFVKELGHEYRTNFFDRWHITYMKGNEVIGSHRNDFEKLLETGEITDNTIVFNNLVHNKTDFETKWQIPYQQSWLKNLRSAHTSFNSIL
jgi:hypothetical protein